MGAGEGEKPQLRSASELTLTDSASASACMISWDLGNGAEALRPGLQGEGSYPELHRGVQVVKTSALYRGRLVGGSGGAEEGRLLLCLREALQSVALCFRRLPHAGLQLLLPAGNLLLLHCHLLGPLHHLHLHPLLLDLLLRLGHLGGRMLSVRAERPVPRTREARAGSRVGWGEWSRGSSTSPVESVSYTDPRHA